MPPGRYFVILSNHHSGVSCGKNPRSPTIGGEAHGWRDLIGVRANKAGIMPHKIAYSLHITLDERWIGFCFQVLSPC